MKRLFLLTVLILSVSMTCYAHPGRRDDYGGHHDYNNVSGLGSYHYHHGYGPHLHENGICPYDYDDQTNTSSGSGSSGTSSRYYEDVEPVERYTYSKYGSYKVWVCDNHLHLPNCPSVDSYYAEKKLNEVYTSTTPCLQCEPLKNENVDSVFWAPYNENRIYLKNNTFHLIGCPKSESGGMERTLKFMKIDEVSPCDFCNPLKYQSISDVPRLWVENAKEFFLENIYVIFVSVIVIWYTVPIFVNFFSKIKEAKQQKEKEKNEHEHYLSLYSGKDPIEFVQPPKGVFLVDGLPATDNRLKYGLYSVYITPKGTRYHRRKSCANSKNVQLTNLYLVHKRMYPCKMCCQRYNPNMDFEWYEKYLEIKEIKKKYNIP